MKFFTLLAMAAIALTGTIYYFVSNAPEPIQTQRVIIIDTHYDDTSCWAEVATEAATVETYRLGKRGECLTHPRGTVLEIPQS